MPNKNGRHPKSPADKALRGNPGKRDLKVIDFGEPLKKTDPPEHLNEKAQLAWRQFSPSLIKSKLLTETSVSMFEGFCVSFAMWRDAADYVKNETLTIEADNGRKYYNQAFTREKELYDRVLKTAVEFGMTPVSIMRAGGQDGEEKKSSWQEWSSS